MLIFVLILLCGEASAQVTLDSNAKEILQRDNLLLLAVIENKSESALTVFSQPGRPNHIQLELFKDGDWVPVDVPRGDFMPGSGRILLDGMSTYAETKTLQIERWGFVFEAPGTYKLRGVAKMPWGDQASEPLVITVKERSAADLKRIKADVLGYLEAGAQAPLPEKLLALQSVGGNIARTIEYSQKTRAVAEETPWKGVTVRREEACDWLRKELDPVSAEHALLSLGNAYRTKKNIDGIFRVLSALPHDSAERRELLYFFRLSAPKEDFPEKSAP